uniref:Uncharacterized protein n=1 Tax=Anopheles dirus TaxID=7168 RepID=A0A182NUK8_9DIPT
MRKRRREEEGAHRTECAEIAPDECLVCDRKCVYVCVCACIFARVWCVGGVAGRKRKSMEHHVMVYLVDAAAQPARTHTHAKQARLHQQQHSNNRSSSSSRSSSKEASTYFVLA